MAEFAGDFLTFCGDDRGASGEKTACACELNGVDTGGVAAAGVLPCCEAACFMAVGVAIACIFGVFERGREGYQMYSRVVVGGVVVQWRQLESPKSSLSQGPKARYM